MGDGSGVASLLLDVKKVVVVRDPSSECCKRPE